MKEELTRNEGGFNLHFDDSLPVNILKPDMLLDLIRTIKAEAIGWLALKSFIDKICGLHGPALGDIGFPQIDLALYDAISNVLASLASIGALPKHQLIADDAQSKVVHGNSMVLSAHDFRGHIPRGPRGVIGVVWAPHF